MVRPARGVSITALLFSPGANRSWRNPYLFTAANACFAAAIVCWTSSAECVAPKNAASYYDGGRYTPLSRMLGGSVFGAPPQSVPGPAAKSQVNFEPTRF